MSTAEARPVIVRVDRATPAGCIAFAAAEAHRRSCGLIVVINGPLTARLRQELEAIRADRPSVSTTVDAGSDGGVVVTGGPHATIAVGSTGTPQMVFRPTVAPLASVAPVAVALDVEPTNSLLEFAFEEARRRATFVRAVYVPTRLDDTVDPAVESSLRETLDRWADKYPDVPVRFTVIAGIDGAVALTVASRSAQLVVLSSADADGPTSIAATVVRRAGCPVAIVA